MLKHPFEQELTPALKDYDILVKKDYLNKLTCSTLPPYCTHNECILLFKINTFATSTVSSFFTYVFNALASQKATIGFILDKSDNMLNFYFGIKVASSPQISSEIFFQGFLSTFPSSTLQPLDQVQSSELLAKLFAPDNIAAITSTIVIPNTTNSKHMPILNKFATLCSIETYTALFLAEPLCSSENEKIINDLTDLYSTLSQFTQSTNNMSKGVAHNSSCTVTQNQSNSCGNSCTHTEGSSQGCSSAAYDNITPSTTIPLGESKRTVNLSVTFNHAIGNNQGSNCSTAKGENSSHSKGDSESNLTATNLTENKLLIYTKQNKAVADALASLTNIIARLTAASNTSLFCFSAFFLAPFESTTIRAGYTYAGLAKDTTLNLEPTYINTWPASNPTFLPLLNTLRHFSIPCFSSPRHHKPLNACTLITSDDLLNTFYFPVSTPNI